MSDKLEKACPCKAAEELSVDELDKAAGGADNGVFYDPGTYFGKQPQDEAKASAPESAVQKYISRKLKG
ncbi:MAG: hypothetical protein HUJ65_07530 [Oscillospiraceae bacterium]|nr:hypothetical protein [Oscillospiraceae bacterium]